MHTLAACKALYLLSSWPCHPNWLVYASTMAHKEEEDQREPIDLRIPILTTRRPITGDTAGQATRRCRLERERSSRIGAGGCVPFSWEKTPGMPKNSNAVNGSSTVAADVPSPRPPPNRWCPSSRRHCSNFGRDEEEDLFTDAMDIISLSESFDVACSMNHNSGSSSLNSEALKSAGSLSPNFIIRRFLPDANALACSSLQALQKYGGNEEDSPRRERGRAQRREGSKSFSSYLSTNTGNSTEKGSPRRFKLRSHSPPKACGLDLLSPLIKHSICGLGSPVKRLAPHVKLVIKRQHKHHTKDGDSPFEPKRKKEKLDNGKLLVGSVGRVSHLDGERGSGSEDEASMERFGSRSAPCSGMNAWAVSSLPSP